jgi:hypothetical protein
MPDDDARDQISRLEARIDELAEIVERCRKVDLASKIAIAVGGLWTLAMMLGIIGDDVVAVIAAMTAVIGGIVVFGSNASTSQQTLAAMAEAEALRAELIGSLRLRVVDSGLAAPVDDRT